MLQVTVEHITDFFVKHAMTDNLGQIANAWLVHADREQEGASCGPCLDLAQLHSTAVDFPKRGEWQGRGRRVGLPCCTVLSFTSWLVVGVHRQSCRSSIFDPLNVTPRTHLVRIPFAVNAKCDARACR
jgi:hypothetical protein